MQAVLSEAALQAAPRRCLHRHRFARRAGDAHFVRRQDTKRRREQDRVVARGQADGHRRVRHQRGIGHAVVRGVRGLQHRHLEEGGHRGDSHLRGDQQVHAIGVGVAAGHHRASAEIGDGGHVPAGTERAADRRVVAVQVGCHCQVE